jgi:hypothetical protein
VDADKTNAKAQALKPAVPTILAPVKRWAALFSAIARLNAEYNDSQIHNNLEELSSAMQTLLYRIRLLFAKPQDGTIFHIMNLLHIVSILRAADRAPLRTQLSSEVLPPDSGGLGADAMAICEAFESILALVTTQYKEKVLSSHLKEMVAYVSKAQGLLKAGRKAEELSATLGEVARCRVRCSGVFIISWPLF